MLHKPARVGVTFHAMIVEKLYAFFGRFTELVLGVRRHGDDGALKGHAGNHVVVEAPITPLMPSPG